MQFKDINNNSSFMWVIASLGIKEVTFPDGCVKSIQEIKNELGFPQLYAWKNDKKGLNELVEFKRKHPQSPVKIIVDSNAFSTWTLGKSVDIDEYIEYLNSIDDVLFWAAELDHIPGHPGEPRTYKQTEVGAQKSWENYVYMIQHIKHPKKILPVFHQGENFKYLKRILNHRFNDNSLIEYIGIAPNNKIHKNSKANWIKQVWDVIKTSCNPNVHVHYFGMTSPEVLNTFPSTSADSTSWLQHAIRGNIMVLCKDNTCFKNVYIGKKKSNDPTYIKYQDITIKKEINRICTKIGHKVTAQSLIEDNYLAFVYNLYSINDWNVSFVNKNYKHDNSKKVNLW